MSKKGSLLIELLISMAVFTILGSLLVMLIYQDQFLITSNSLRSKTLIIAKDHLDSVLNDIKNNFDLVSSTSTDQGYQVVTTILPVDNFTTSVQVNVFYKLMNRLVSSAFSASVTDTRESEGQSSCRPTQDKMKWKLPVKSIIDLSSFINSGNDITDSDVVGNYLYLATNSAITTDADLYIFDISNYSSPLLLSSLDTGPGLLSLAVAGHFAYLGNTSINKQLQIVDVSNKTNPQFISSFKIPGTYKDATTVGNSVFYKKGIIYLGTQKSVTNELHAIDVSLPTSPHELSTAEIGNAVNDLFAFKDRLYVATPNNEELKVFQINPDGTLMLLSVFDAPGGSGNGKRLSLFLNTLYLGRTVGKDELFALSASSSPLVKNFSFPIAASIEGVFGYGSLLYILSTNTSDGFGVYDSALATSTRVNVKVGFPLTPIGFDCDQNTFYISLENSRLIYVIKPSL